MAKFVIAMCFVLVFCGVPGSTALMTSLNDITSKVNSYIANLTTIQAGLLANSIQASDTLNNFIAYINYNVTTTIDTFTENITAEFGTVQNAYECIKDNNFTQKALAAAANATACANNATAKLQAGYNSTTANITAFISELQNLTAKARNCPSSMTTTLTCLTDILAYINGPFTLKLVNLINAVSIIISEYTNFGTTLAACSSNSALATLPKQLREDLDAIQECVFLNLIG